MKQALQEQDAGCMQPKGIVLHGARRQGADLLLCRSPLPPFPRLHFLVEEGGITQWAEPTLQLEGTSDKEHNDCCIQIALCTSGAQGVLSEQALARALQLCGSLMRQFSFDKLLRHYDVTGKYCPDFLLDEQRWAAFRRQLQESVGSSGGCCKKIQNQIYYRHSK